MDDKSFICNYEVTDKIYNDNTVVIGLFLKKPPSGYSKHLGPHTILIELKILPIWWQNITKKPGANPGFSLYLTLQQRLHQLGRH